MSFDQLKMYGEFISRMKIDKKYNFMYTAIPYDTYVKFGKPAKVSSSFSSLYGSAIKGIDIGIVMLEREKNIIDISFRSKKNDISLLAKELGGGGHKNSSGACVKEISFRAAVNYILKIVRKNVKNF